MKKRSGPPPKPKGESAFLLGDKSLSDISSDGHSHHFSLQAGAPDLKASEQPTPPPPTHKRVGPVAKIHAKQAPQTTLTRKSKDSISSDTSQISLNEPRGPNVKDGRTPPVKPKVLSSPTSVPPLLSDSDESSPRRSGHVNSVREEKSPRMKKPSFPPLTKVRPKLSASQVSGTSIEALGSVQTNEGEMKAPTIVLTPRSFLLQSANHIRKSSEALPYTQALSPRLHPSYRNAETPRSSRPLTSLSGRSGSSSDPSSVLNPGNPPPIGRTRATASTTSILVTSRSSQARPFIVPRMASEAYTGSCLSSDIEFLTPKFQGLSGKAPPGYLPDGQPPISKYHHVPKLYDPATPSGVKSPPALTFLSGPNIQPMRRSLTKSHNVYNQHTSKMSMRQTSVAAQSAQKVPPSVPHSINQYSESSSLSEPSEPLVPRKPLSPPLVEIPPLKHLEGKAFDWRKGEKAIMAPVNPRIGMRSLSTEILPTQALPPDTLNASSNVATTGHIGMSELSRKVKWFPSKRDQSIELTDRDERHFHPEDPPNTIRKADSNPTTVNLTEKLSKLTAQIAVLQQTLVGREGNKEAEKILQQERQRIEDKERELENRAEKVLAKMSEPRLTEAVLRDLQEALKTRPSTSEKERVEQKDREIEAARAELNEGFRSLKDEVAEVGRKVSRQLDEVKGSLKPPALLEEQWEGSESARHLRHSIEALTEQMSTQTRMLEEQSKRRDSLFLDQITELAKLRVAHQEAQEKLKSSLEMSEAQRLATRALQKGRGVERLTRMLVRVGKELGWLSPSSQASKRKAFMEWREITAQSVRYAKAIAPKLAAARRLVVILRTTLIRSVQHAWLGLRLQAAVSGYLKPLERHNRRSIFGSTGEERQLRNLLWGDESNQLRKIDLVAPPPLVWDVP